MARINVPRNNIYTHPGAKACHINPEQQLRRSVMSCLLWEKEFYEDGENITSRIKKIIPEVQPEKVAQIAIDARNKSYLRHVPLFICSVMAGLNTHKYLVANTLAEVIQRPDELTEFLAIYWKNGKCPLANQVKKGLAKAFTKFSEYQLAKYNRDNAIKLKDVLFLCHSKPLTGVKGYTKNARKNGMLCPKDTGSQLYNKLVNNKLEIPDTWEVALSTKDGLTKRAKWERLLTQNKLGGMAFLRNLRNMYESGVENNLIKAAINITNFKKVLPFRFITAAKNVPGLENIIEETMLKVLSQSVKLSGKTILIVDVSGSMYHAQISEKSEMTRIDVACSLAILIRELCERSCIYATAGNDLMRIHKTHFVPSRHGFALSDKVFSLCSPLGGGGIFLKQVMEYVHKKEKKADRIIVITDEQDCDYGNEGSPAKANAFGNINYLINVASAKNGIGYGKWIHIDGWSENVIHYIQEIENCNIKKGNE